MFQWVIEGLRSKTRLSDIPLEVIPTIYSKSQWKKLIKSHKVLLNEKVGQTGDWVNNGDAINVDNNRPTGKPYPLKLEMIFEDDDLFVVNKPGGIIVSGNQHRTLENAVLHHYEILQKELTFIPRFIHRLDAQTSGLIIGARTYSSMLHLQDQLQRYEMEKEYIAMVEGEVPLTMKISIPIKRKSATTIIEKIKTIQSNKYGSLSLVRIFLQEGRTHQIRIHLSCLGHPCMGDKLYNNSITREIKGLFLNASRIILIHPITEEKLVFKSPLPKRFKKFGISQDDLPH